MSLLPTNWVQAPIGSLCDLKNGRAFKPAEWSQDGLPIVRIQNLNNGSAPFNRFNGAYDNRHYLKGGELLFAWSGTPGTSFGAHVWLGGKALLNQHIFRVDFDDALLDRRFFRHAINQKLTELIGVAHGGAGLQHVTKGVFEGTEVALPPRLEQKRIADTLDTVLTRVDTVNTRLARVAPILKRFRQSVLAAATSGQLTADWRATHGINAGVETTLQTICMPDRVITYGVVKLGDDTPGGTPCLRTSNVRWLRFELDGMKLIHPRLSAEYQRTVLRGGEVLVNVRGTLGGVAVATDDMTGWNVSREVAVVPIDQALADPAYISFWIASDECQRWLTGVAKGVAYTGINIEDLRTLPLKLPSKDEQAEIVRRVETLFAFADRIDARVQDVQMATERLTPAFMAKAFSGQLVPQDPNDEPASKLLRRLQQEAPSISTKKRGRKTAI
ncbi:restriction endonuclease subunit S [Hydrogenophaga palleronii]|uniref:restriction endonuclease subunit S n=1 Tax=Hydrogenophaga palleronii TaxID=65655 RepID=UPI000A011B5C|nr:restriction endonuclease subunit S [Hydrogenophaga palleronii]